MTQQRTAIIFGANGLVGRNLTLQLLAHPAYAKVVAVTRCAFHPQRLDNQEIQADYSKYHNVNINFESALFDSSIAGLNAKQNLSDIFSNRQDLLLCLGTTMKKARSKLAFKRVDFEYPCAIAHLAKQQGVERAVLISAIGAQQRSPFFYSRIKAQTEDYIKQLHFNDLLIAQPSLLLGKRDESRHSESLAQVILPIFSPLLIAPLNIYRPIAASLVASTILRTLTIASAGNNDSTSNSNNVTYLTHKDFIQCSNSK